MHRNLWCIFSLVGGYCQHCFQERWSKSYHSTKRLRRMGFINVSGYKLNLLVLQLSSDSSRNWNPPKVTSVVLIITRPSLIYSTSTRQSVLSPHYLAKSVLVRQNCAFPNARLSFPRSPPLWQALRALKALSTMFYGMQINSKLMIRS